MSIRRVLYATGISLVVLFTLSNCLSGCAAMFGVKDPVQSVRKQFAELKEELSLPFPAEASENFFSYMHKNYSGRLIAWATVTDIRVMIDEHGATNIPKHETFPATTKSKIIYRASLIMRGDTLKGILDIYLSGGGSIPGFLRSMPTGAYACIQVTVDLTGDEEPKYADIDCIEELTPRWEKKLLTLKDL